MIWDFYRKESSLKDVKAATCFFNDNDCYFWGWLYSEKGNIIGDYKTTDSTEIEKYLPINFNMGV